MDRTNNLCEYLEGLYMGKGSLRKNGKAQGDTSEGNKGRREGRKVGSKGERLGMRVIK